MTVIRFLLEWTIRSSVLIVAGAALLWILRVKDVSARLAAWTAVLCCSLVLPLLSLGLPRLRLPSAPVPHVYSRAAASSVDVPAVPPQPSMAPHAPRFDWVRALAAVYAAGSATLLFRLGLGLLLGNRMVRKSRPAGSRGAVELRESDALATPVTLGIVRPVVVLPTDWRGWNGAKLNAVLAHELSHVFRYDPGLQLLSAVHRALLWHNPLSWLLHTRIVRLAEDASDDAAVAVTSDRATYAEVLLDFLRSVPRHTRLAGVAMARYGSPERRIDRILEGTPLSRGVTRWTIALIAMFGLPLACVVAAAHPESPIQVHETYSATAADVSGAAPIADVPIPRPPAPPPPQEGRSGIRRYVIVDGDSRSGSWSSDDNPDQEALMDKFGTHFAWFRLDGKNYVITDAGILDELRAINEPQKAVNRMQADVNAQQQVVNGLQSDVNSQQSVVNAHQSEVNRRQDLLNRLQSAQSGALTDEDLIRRLEATLAELRQRKGEALNQDMVNREQAKVNDAQAGVNAEQNKVNQAQAKVNDEQRRVSAEYSRRIQEVFHSALDRHLARELQ